jgi:hypothetical protein
MRKTETIFLKVALGWDPKKEDKRGALAQALIAVGEGIANYRTSGALPNKGAWELGAGTELIEGSQKP